MAFLTKQDILRGLHRLDEKARGAKVIVDMAVYGGAALALVFDLRQATRDVDAVVRGSQEFLRRAAGEIAEEEGWPADWLNDGVKGFLSHHEELRALTEFQASNAGGLRLYVPVPEYLFAMKCMAMRPEGIEGSRDIADIEALADKIGVASTDAALALVEKFYPASRIPPKVRFGVEEIMERVLVKRKKDAKA
ncbi:MAG: DUF6036 family nucleotidyltransferase [Nitrospira sp.]|nr:DUF6036 family nucleotidyltransferase [Nitrospira sp.]MDH4368608.1 DUF6036 family nucleotidyltransferase [Nitrospira sp.]MDH5346688.1 DUF6036 family nucleotidyltransferase [Nitrospira sp.]MDH5496447.1 DUF6036 family nucleotidyltransferase [Nitrospira sp.]MDH5724809.1 DUF6036 family nucleotidyltransferase [Nitrospira sp.]